MGNENKVKDLVKQSKDTFLKDISRFLDDKPKLYNLNERFAETRKNKNSLVYFSTGIFLAAIILGTILITSWVQYNSRKVTFKISEFESVNLSDLLSTVKKSENQLNNAKKDQSEIRMKQQKDVEKVKARYSKKCEAIYKKDYSKNKEKRLIKELRSKERKEIASAKKKYSSKLKSKQREINQAQKDINQYDKKLQAAHKAAEEIVNNFKRLHNIKMKEQRNILINRYNPYFRSQPLAKYVHQKIDRNNLQSLNLNDYDPDLQKRKVFHKSDFEKLRKNINYQSLIITRLRKVPYQNSVAPSLVHLDDVSRGIINDYEKLWSNLVIRNKIINNYEFAFKHLAKTQSESGYIIDARDTKNIRVVMNKLYKIKSDQIGLVFRTEDEYIGKIKFFRESGELKAEIIEIEPEKAMNPFDKILIQIGKE